MTSYKRCDSLPNYEVSFTKNFYPIYYNLFLYLLWLNVGKTKKANSGLKTPQKGQKAYLSRRSFSEDGRMPTRHGVERRAKPELEAGSPFC